jgi:hypothetical protein
VAHLVHQPPDDVLGRGRSGGARGVTTAEFIALADEVSGRQLDALSSSRADA